MDLIRVLIVFTCKYDFWFTVSHIPGRLNEATDDISRSNIRIYVPFTVSRGRFLTTYSLPPLLVTLLSQNITWTSENCSEALCSRSHTYNVLPINLRISGEVLPGLL